MVQLTISEQLVISLITILLASFFLRLLFIWIDTPQVSSSDTTIPFKAFEKFYTINPNRWELDIYNVTCIIDDSNWWCPQKQIFWFKFNDYQKYKKFLKKINKNKAEYINMKATAEMLNAVKQDIANMESLAQQQKKQAVDNLEFILRNLQGGTK